MQHEFQVVGSASTHSLVNWKTGLEFDSLFSRQPEYICKNQFTMMMLKSLSHDFFTIEFWILGDFLTLLKLMTNVQYLPA